jgi:hypothetical protein
MQVVIKPWSESLISTGLVIAVLVIAPWAGALLGIVTFVGTILATVFAALLANILLTHSFITLPVKWYVAGRSEGMAK